MKLRICFLLTVSLFFFTGSSFAKKNPKNIILLIGDGMGLAQIYSGMVANNNKLELERCTHSGFSKTYSADNLTTDSGAGGTALACGVKTKNGMIGMSPDSVAVPSILHFASEKKLATGVVAACAVTHATPASFVAHQVYRYMNEEIAADYLKANIDVFIGGGKKYFDDRKDKRNLIKELEAKDFPIAYTLTDVKAVKDGKLAGLLYDEHNPGMPDRGDMLPDATVAAIDILDNNKNGFFLMVEGSQIDWASHSNDGKLVIKEVLDFDKTIGKVLDFAEKDGNTLVIITADHETGGMSILDGQFGEDTMKIAFTSKGHSALPVPIFAYGPGAENFSGFMENISIHKKMMQLLKLNQ